MHLQGAFSLWWALQPQKLALFSLKTKEESYFISFQTGKYSFELMAYSELDSISKYLLMLDKDMYQTQVLFGQKYGDKN